MLGLRPIASDPLSSGSYNVFPTAVSSITFGSSVDAEAIRDAVGTATLIFSPSVAGTLISDGSANITLTFDGAVDASRLAEAVGSITLSFSLSGYLRRNPYGEEIQPLISSIYATSTGNLEPLIYTETTE